MKRKQLSLKKLTWYVGEYLFEDWKRNNKNEIIKNRKLKVLKEYLDYIWKNPK